MKTPPSFLLTHIDPTLATLLLLGIGTATASAQIANPTAVSLNFDNTSTAYTQNFNILPSTGTSFTPTPGTNFPNGWGFTESGTSANGTITLGTGSSTTGDTYNFGSTGATDRALGGLQSGALIPIIGVKFSNGTGLTLVDATISYRGEQWRLGATGRPDRLDFQYSATATALNAGTYADLDSLDFLAPKSTGTAGALDGNVSGNFSNISGLATNLGVASGDSLFLRWSSFDATGSDDGLAVDDFSIRIDKLGTTGINSAITSLSAPPTLTIQNGAATASTLTATITVDETFAGVLQDGGAGKLSLTKAGNNTLTLTNTNTYSGNTNISAGTLLLGSGGSLSSSTAVDLSTATAKFDLAGIATSQTILKLSGVASSEVNLSGKTLDISGTSPIDNATFSGNLVGSGGNLTKSGSSTQTLSGSNTYTGNTNITAGTLLLGANDVLPNSATLNLSSGATLATGGFVDATGAFSILGDAVIDVGTGNTSALTFASVLTWSGVLSIWNYTGGVLYGNSLGDKLLFTDSSGVDITKVRFFYDNGITPYSPNQGGILVGAELVPVPEPSALVGAGVLLGLAFRREMKRRRA